MPDVAHSEGSSSASHAVGLQRWETDGGAIGPPVNQHSEVPTRLPEKEAFVLQCLGSAVLSLWNGLPTRLQRELFTQALGVVSPRQVAQLKKRMGRFLHDHKDDAGGAR